MLNSMSSCTPINNYALISDCHCLAPVSRAGFVDEGGMLHMVDAIFEERHFDGLLNRYESPDNLSSSEGVFLACTFLLAAWLVSDVMKKPGNTMKEGCRIPTISSCSLRRRSRV